MKLWENEINILVHIPAKFGLKIFMELGDIRENIFIFDHVTPVPPEECPNFRGRVFAYDSTIKKRFRSKL